MADVKISGLPASTTPLAGTEVLPIVQGGATKQVSIANVTAGRAVSAASLALTTTPLAVGSGGTGLTTLTAGRIPYGNGVNALSSSAGLFFDGSSLGVGTSTPANVIEAAANFSGAIGVRVTNTSQTNQYLSVSMSGNSAAVAGWDNSGVIEAIALSVGSGTRGLVLSGYSGPVIFQTSARTERMRIQSSGGVSIGDTTDPGAGNLRLGTGNLVIGTSGKGIDFSATPNTGTSELFADYEEGTWTPVLASATGSITSYTVSSATYTKVGRQVTLNFYIIITDNGTGGASLLVTGVPYTITGGYASSVGAAQEIQNTGLGGFIKPSTTAQLVISSYSNGYLGATGNRVIASISYNV